WTESPATSPPASSAKPSNSATPTTRSAPPARPRRPTPNSSAPSAPCTSPTAKPRSRANGPSPARASRRAACVSSAPSPPPTAPGCSLRSRTPSARPWAGRSGLWAAPRFCPRLRWTPGLWIRMSAKPPPPPPPPQPHTPRAKACVCAVWESGCMLRARAKVWASVCVECVKPPREWARPCRQSEKAWVRLSSMRVRRWGRASKRLCRVSLAAWDHWGGVRIGFTFRAFCFFLF
ncbi:hypothetical protein FN846DRAFT_999071, partial [Sphaerosporella brunnea]